MWMAAGLRADVTEFGARATLRRMFELDEHPLRQIASSPMRPAVAGVVVSEIAFATAKGEPVRGIWCRPANQAGPLPAVLVIHAHGDRYDIGADELMQGRPALQAPLGPAMAAIGIATLCIDMPCFGRRSSQSESLASKARLWEGHSLAGQMLGENRSALDWLAGNHLVRPDRIGLFGISMGATLGYWLAALDPRVRALAQICCLADFRTLIDMGAHDLHGIYLTVPGLPTVASNGTIAGMMAPRAQFVGLGDIDPLTPPRAADVALAEVQRAYRLSGGDLLVHREPGSGHSETAGMRRAMLQFMKAQLT